MTVDICCDYFMHALECRKNLSEKCIWYGNWNGTGEYFLKERGKPKISEVDTEGRAPSICTVKGRKYIHCFGNFRNYGQNSTPPVRMKRKSSNCCGTLRKYITAKLPQEGD